MRKIKKICLLFILTFTMLMAATVCVSAAPKLNKKSKTMTVGQTYTLKVKGINAGNIKKVTFKSGNKKVVSVSKDIISSKKSRVYKTYSKACVCAKKKGKTTITVRVTYWTKKSTLKTKKMKFKVTVKKAKPNRVPDNIIPNNDTNNNDTNDNDSGTIHWYQQNIKWINDYTVYFIDDDEYGIVYTRTWEYNPTEVYNSIEVYSKQDYDNVMEQLNGILKSIHITEDNNMTVMSDQEKAYRIGRWITHNIDYEVNVSTTIQDTLTNKKSQCHGLSVLYKILCNMAGVDCEYIYTVDHYINGQNMNHAWNIVRLGNYWYVVDMTDARHLRDDNQPGVVLSAYFRPNGEIRGKEKLKYLHPYYKSKEFMDTHPIDTLELPAREKADGIKFLTDKELYNLPL